MMCHEELCKVCRMFRSMSKLFGRPKLQSICFLAAVAMQAALVACSAAAMTTYDRLRGRTGCWQRVLAHVVHCQQQ